MAEEHQATNVGETEIKDRGMFDFLKGKKEEEKPQEEVLATEMEKVHVSEPEQKKEEVPVVVHEEEKKPSLLEKLHRSDSSSSSSSSSEEEVEENGEKIKRKKKKGLKEKIQEKISGEKKVEAEDTSIPIEKCDDEVVGVVTHDGEVPHPVEKKSFIDKIKDKLPGGTSKKPDDATTPVTDVHVSHPVHAAVPSDAPAHEVEPKEKKGILEKIKEKLPGYHKSEEEKETTTDH